MIRKIATLSETSLACLAGAAFFALTCVGLINNYSPVPFWDMWDGIVLFETRVIDHDYAAFWMLHVNHRTVVSNVLFHLDQVAFGGTNLFLIIMNVVLLAGVVGMLAWLCRAIMPERRYLKHVLIVTGLSCALCFSWIQKENLTWAFQISMFASQFFPLLTVLSIFKAGVERKHVNAWFGVALIAGFISPFTMMSGLLALPLALACIFFYRLGWVRIGMMAIVMAAAFTLYFIGYQNPEGQSDIGSSLLHSTPNLIRFALILIGAPTHYVPHLGVSYAIPLIVGGFMAVSGVAMSSYLCLKPETRNVGILFLALLGFEALTAFGIAAGRAATGIDQAFVSRYMTTSLVAWSIYLMLVVYMFRDVLARSFLSLILFAPVLILAPAQASAREVSVDARLQRLGAALAIELGIKDEQQIGNIWPWPDVVFILAKKARAYNTSIFGNPMFRDVAEHIGGAAPERPEGACEGRIFNTTPVAKVPEEQRVNGMVAAADKANLPDAMLISDSIGRVVGYAVTSSTLSGIGLDQSGGVQFVGYVQTQHAPGALHFDGRTGKCSFGGAKTRSNEIKGQFDAIAAWQGPGGDAASGGLENREFKLPPMGGVMSGDSLAAREGDKFAVEYSIKLLRAPKNGKPANYVVGPMFRDGKGNILAWGGVEPPLTEPQRNARVETVAPAGTESVRLYIGGMWGPDGAPDGEVAYTSAKLSTVFTMPPPATAAAAPDAPPPAPTAASSTRTTPGASTP